MTASIETVPTLTLEAYELENLLGEVETYHEIYRPLFQRREQRERSQEYLYGLLMPEIPDKAIEPLILALKGDDPNAIRSMQHFVSEGAWDDDAMLKQHWREVAQDLGEAVGVYTLDGSDFPKQGAESVGVKRQYCGQLGKIANCQAGVFLGYASSQGYTLLHRVLYLSEEWLSADAAYAERRTQCGIPDSVKFQTKPALGRDLLRSVRGAGDLPGQWLACDEAFGRVTDFLDQVAELDLRYYAEVPHDTYVWHTRPATYLPEWSGRGRKPTRKQLVAGEPAPQTVRDLAESIPATAWHRYTIKEGRKGPVVADFALLRVVDVRASLPGADIWLIARRNVASGELKLYLSNAPADTPHLTVVRISGMRWPIETAFEDSKQLVGMGIIKCAVGPAGSII